MSWNLKKKAQALLAEEQGTFHKEWGGKVAIALVYPNTYAVGMSNLGFQTIYWHLNQLPDVVCERVFLPDLADVEQMRRTETAPFSLESQRPLSDFHMVGFSVTYEGDYINTLRLLHLAGIPLRAAERRPGDPLVLMGGVCAFSNPEPMAPFMDFVAVGEGEELVRELIALYRDTAGDRDAFLERVGAVAGVYVPGQYDIAYHPDGTPSAVLPRAGAPAVVVKRRLPDVNRFETISLVKTPQAEYGHMALLEVGKGCGRGCRFCLEGQVYRPVRHRSVATLGETVARLAQDPANRRIGLVGACVSDYPWIGDLLKVVEANSLELSISSIRADSLTDDLVAALARGGHRTLTVAPEAGTERLRRGDPQGDHRRADSGRVRPGPRARDPEPQDLLHNRPADGDARGRGGDSAPRRTDARAPLRARPEGQAVRPLDALDLVLRPEALDAVPVGALRRGRGAPGEARDRQARRPAPPQRAGAPREPAW